jgi:hypothetical protein
VRSLLEVQVEISQVMAENLVQHKAITHSQLLEEIVVKLTIYHSKQ